jgi:hypothetical protein
MTKRRKKTKKEDGGEPVMPVTLEDKIEMDIKHESDDMERIIHSAMENTDAENLIAELMSEDTENEFD